MYIWIGIKGSRDPWPTRLSQIISRNFIKASFGHLRFLYIYIFQIIHFSFLQNTRPTFPHPEKYVRTRSVYLTYNTIYGGKGDTLNVIRFRKLWRKNLLNLFFFSFVRSRDVFLQTFWIQKWFTKIIIYNVTIKDQKQTWDLLYVFSEFVKYSIQYWVIYIFFSKSVTL